MMMMRFRESLLFAVIFYRMRMAVPVIS
jgi:hypothetical protein